MTLDGTCWKTECEETFHKIEYLDTFLLSEPSTEVYKCNYCWTTPVHGLRILIISVQFCGTSPYNITFGCLSKGFTYSYICSHVK